MTPTQELVAEHEAVLVGLQLLDKITGALVRGEQEAPAHLDALLDFFRGFVDRCHHGKEEDVLFPELERRGIPREGGPIGVMLAEHEIGRGHVRAMAEGLARAQASDASGAVVVRESAVAYGELLRAHIFKENNVLFPAADRLLSNADAADVAARFAAIERDRVGEGKHEAYHAMLHRLMEACGVK